MPLLPPGAPTKLPQVDGNVKPTLLVLTSGWKYGGPTGVEVCTWRSTPYSDTLGQRRYTNEKPTWRGAQGLLRRWIQVSRRRSNRDVWIPARRNLAGCGGCLVHLQKQSTNQTKTFECYRWYSSARTTPSGYQDGGMGRTSL